MDGRVYDPRLGRFLSPDPYVQDPTYSQSLNRYSYCVNNPLKYIDPSGYTWLSKFNSWIKSNWKPIVTTAVAVAAGIAVAVLTGGIGSPILVAMLSGAASGFAGGVMGTALNGGNLNECLFAGVRGALIGAIAGLAGGVAGVGAAWALNTVTGISGGVIGGAIAGAAGGFAGGFIGSVMMGMNIKESLKMGAYGAAAGGVIGGIVGGYKVYRNNIRTTNPKTNIWTNKPLAPGRSQFSLVNSPTGRKVYLTSGRTYGIPESSYKSAIRDQYYNSDKWYENSVYNPVAPEGNSFNVSSARFITVDPMQVGSIEYHYFGTVPEGCTLNIYADGQLINSFGPGYYNNTEVFLNVNSFKVEMIGSWPNIEGAEIGSRPFFYNKITTNVVP